MKMAWGSRICSVCSKFQYLLVVQKPAVNPAISLIPVRHKTTNKHYDPKFRHLRWKKFIKIDLPDYDKMRREATKTPDEIRAEMKKKGLPAMRQGPQERDLTISCTGGIFEPYVPPEGDGKKSAITPEGAKQRTEEMSKKGKSKMQERKIRQFDDDFKTGEFAEKAMDIYIEAHSLIQDVKKNEDRLHQLVTEYAYPNMIWQLEKKTVYWKLHEYLDPPRVVHIRTQEMMHKENIYAQITVRFHTSQIMAIYDRFGRVQFGSENVVKDILEYVVFEKHLSNLHSDWRIQGKIIPEWMPPRTEVIRTMRQPRFDPIKDVESEKKDSDPVATSDDLDGKRSKPSSETTTEPEVDYKKLGAISA